MNFRNVFSVLLLHLGVFCSHAQFYNGSEQDFGKNRVQYFEFDWKSQNYERFKIYFYRGEDDLAEYAAKSFQRELYSMEEKLNFSISEHLEIILFKSLNEFRQSNIGLIQENEDEYGGKSQIIGNKLFVFYEGEQEAFQRQIRQVLAETVIRNILFGDQWSDVLIASDPSKHPDWFIGGLVSYLSTPWNADLESKLKDGFLTGRYDDFSRMNEDESRLAGHAFWYYIEETYGKTQLMNILYITKLSGHVDRSMLYVLGSDMGVLVPSCGNFFKKRFLSDVQFQEDPSGDVLAIRLKKNQRITDFAINSDQTYWVYSKNREGRYGIYLRNAETKKETLIKRYDARLARIQDYSYPVFAFHPNGRILVFFQEYRGKTLFNLYDLEDESLITKELPKLEKVLSADYSPDGLSLVLSGVKNGQSDLYLYRVSGNSLEELTEDGYDDLDPSWTADGENIVFSSNRISDTLPKKEESIVRKSTSDLFLYPVKRKNNNKVVLERLTDTPTVNESKIKETKKDEYLYVSDANGLKGMWKIAVDSTVAFIDTAIHYRYVRSSSPLTNWNTGVLDYSLLKDNQVVCKIRQNNQFKLLQTSLSAAKELPNETYFKRKKNQKQGPQTEEEGKEKPVEIIDSVIPKNIVFSADSTYEKEVLVLYQNEEEFFNESSTASQRFAYGRPRIDKYKVNFAKDFISAKIENGYLNQSYQRFSGTDGVYLNPSVSGLLRISFSDVMEDYVFSGAIRIPTSRNNSEFFASIDFLRKRLDKQVKYYRRSYEESVAKGVNKIITHEVTSTFKYPFSEVFSFRTTAKSRTDIIHALALDEPSLVRAVDYRYSGGVNLALVFDNARQYTDNCWSGWRAKVFAELLQEVGTKQIGMINLGFDVRNAQYIVKEMIWVNRIAFGTSIGNDRLVYYMGGVDNWMLRPEVSFNKNIPVDPAGRFAYQTLATPMRGFIQNQRNGSSFAIWNSELRIPLFKLLTKKPVKNEPLRSFQLIGFFDLGTAWTGPHPFSEKNFFNVETINNKPALIKVINGREPVIAASGFGVRSKLFGYFVRADLGWGIENGQFRKKPRLFLSLTHDI